MTRVKKPRTRENGNGAFAMNCLAMTYFHMGRPHTIIGAQRFHF